MDRKARLVEKIGAMRKLMNLNESADIPYAEQLPDEDVDSEMSKIKQYLGVIDQILNTKGAKVINTLSHATVASEFDHYKSEKKQLASAVEKLRTQHNTSWDAMERLEKEGIDVSKLEKLISDLDDKTSMLDEIVEIMDEMITRVTRFKNYFPHLLSLNTQNVGGTNITKI